MRNRVVVTGMGLITPLNASGGLDIFWDRLCAGEDAVKEAPAHMPDAGRKWLTAVIDHEVSEEPLDYEDKLPLIAERAMADALEDAGLLASSDEFPSRRGLIMGTVLANVPSKEKRLTKSHCRRLLPGKDPIGRHAASGGGIPGKEAESLSYIGSHLADRYDLADPVTISAACASGTDAIGMAARQIASGRRDIVVAGGADVVSDFALLGFHALKALTADKVRPFDRNRTGLALGEGAAFLILEAETHAAKRGAKVYGRVMGYASRADASHLTSPHREGRGLADALSGAMAEAGLSLRDTGYINAHGTGTIYNDLMETKAIKKVFGSHAYDIPISSTKSMLGHSFGAAGAIEAICCLLAIMNNMIPPTINYRDKDPECDLDYVPNRARKQDIRTALSLSAGFGGQNAALIIGEA